MSIFICVAAAVASFLCFIIGFNRPGKRASDESPSVRRRKWGGLGVLFAVIAVLVFVFVFNPGITRDRLKEADEITRQTFQDKLGHPPDKLIFDNTNRKTALQDGWQYTGTAVLGDKTWDVTVTRDNHETPGQTTLRCEAKLRSN